MFEAARHACKPTSPDHDYYLEVAERLGKSAALSVARKLTRRCHHRLCAVSTQTSLHRSHPRQTPSTSPTRSRQPCHSALDGRLEADDAAPAGENYRNAGPSNMHQTPTAGESRAETSVGH